MPDEVPIFKAKKLSGGKAARVKGDRFENECVNTLKASGVPAQRVPLSGAAGGMFSGDIHVEVCGHNEKAECKVRARAWLDLYGWIVDNYCLFIKRDRNDTLVVMRLTDFIRLSKGIL